MKWSRGAPKARKWADKYFLSVLRADFAQIQNEVLARNGFSIRIAPRTLKAQKEEAFLARLFNRVPEKYVGIISCQDEDNEQLARLKEFRALRKQHFDLVMKLDALAKEADELEVKCDVQLASIRAKNLMDSKEYKTRKFVSEYLTATKRRMLTAVADVNKWKRVIISQHDAKEQAMLEYMTKSEHELWQKYFEIPAQKKLLEDFLKTLRKPDEKPKDSLQAYEQVVAGVKAKIFSLFSASLLMKKSVAEIEQRLDSPECAKNTEKSKHRVGQSRR